MQQTLPESYLRYMQSPFIANRRGEVLRNMDNQQLLDLLVNKPDFMTPQQWHASGGQNFDPDGSLYAQYLSKRAEKNLPLQPTPGSVQEYRGMTPTDIGGKGLAPKALNVEQPDYLARTPNDIGGSGMKPNALDVKQPDYLGSTPRTTKYNPTVLGSLNNAVQGFKNLLPEVKYVPGEDTNNNRPYVKSVTGINPSLTDTKSHTVTEDVKNLGQALDKATTAPESTPIPNNPRAVQYMKALDAAEMAMQPSKPAAPYVAPPSAPAPQSTPVQNGKFTVTAAPVAEAPAAVAPKLTADQIAKAVESSGDTTFGRQALTPRAEGAYTSRVTTSGTNQPTRTQSQQMYYYDPGDGGPVRLMGASLPKGMSAGNQQGGGYIFGLDQPQNRTTAQKVVQGDASGVSSSVGDFFNKLTAKKPGTVDPLTGRSYEPVQASDNVQTEARGGTVHAGASHHDNKCHVGIIHMAVGGRTDHLPMNVYANSYVIPADVVSGLGEGNTLSGGKILDHMFSGESLRKLVNKSVKVPHKASGGPLPITAPMQMGQSQVAVPDVMNFGPMDLEKTGPFGTELPTARANPKFPEPRYSWRYTETPPGEKPKAGAATGGLISDRQAKPVEILAAGGEYVIPPEVVRALGHGDAESGHKWLDNFVKSTRSHTIKTMQKLPGPKKD